MVFIVKSSNIKETVSNRVLHFFLIFASHTKTKTISQTAFAPRHIYDDLYDTKANSNDNQREQHVYDKWTILLKQNTGERREDQIPSPSRSRPGDMRG
jgi:hypothetical protein